MTCGSAKQKAQGKHGTNLSCWNSSRYCVESRRTYLRRVDIQKLYNYLLCFALGVIDAEKASSRPIDTNTTMENTILSFDFFGYQDAFNLLGDFEAFVFNSIDCSGAFSPQKGQ